MSFYIITVNEDEFCAGYIILINILFALPGVVRLFFTGCTKNGIISIKSSIVDKMF